MKNFKEIETGQYDDIFSKFYGDTPERIEEARKRYSHIAQEFRRNFGEEREIQFFSAPGRTEIGGNHTDHQHGCVLTAAVDLDIVAAVSPNQDGVIRFQSEGFSQVDEIDCRDFTFCEKEQGSSAALLRGICAKVQELGYSIGGFDAYSSSKVWKGSGLSSSAAFEILVVTILNQLFCQGEISEIQSAQIAQYAENVYFGKPSGLMDQIACSVGGFVAVDFLDPANPILEKIECNPLDYGYAICIVDTGGSHADLTGDYAAVSEEMGALARAMGHTVLRECKEEELMSAISDLRLRVGDRAVLRGIHFFDENERAIAEKQALQRGDFDRFRDLFLDSGRSSFEYLQNVYSCTNPKEQGIALALAMTQKILEGRGGWRVHGGGFAGTMQALVPLDQLENYQNNIEAVFGKGSCYQVSIRMIGGTEVFQNFFHC